MAFPTVCARAPLSRCSKGSQLAIQCYDECIGFVTRTPPDRMKVAVVITNGTNDPLKCEIGILCGYTALKQGHDVTYILMGEAGNVIDDDILRNVNGFGLPPIAKLLDDEVMQKAEWYAA